MVLFRNVIAKCIINHAFGGICSYESVRILNGDPLGKNVLRCEYNVVCISELLYAKSFCLVLK